MANYNAIKYNGFSKGALTLIKTLTADEDANLSFVDGTSSVVLDSTYKEYIFILNIHVQTEGQLNMFFRDGGTDFDAVCTTSNFSAYNTEDNSNASLYNETSMDVAQGSTVPLVRNIGNVADASAAVIIHLFNPSSTTFVKHFLATDAYSYGSSYGSFSDRKGGYINTTTAIDGVKFQMASGNIDAGTIQLFGLA